MCKVYNTIGCLNSIQFNLVNNNIDEFNTLTELINFRKNYYNNEQKIISDHTLLVKNEKANLEKDIAELNIVFTNRRYNLKQELRHRLDNYNQEIENLPETNSKIIYTIKDYWINLVICIKFWFTQLIFHFKIAVFKYQAKKFTFEKD